MAFHRSTLATLLSLVVAGACAGGPDPAPAWVDAPPNEPGYVHAVGSYVGSLHREDNRKNAVREAIRNLAGQIRTRVRDRIEMRGTANSIALRREAELTAQEVVHNAQTLAFWVDRQGIVAGGKRGTVYVLVRAPVR